jgi:hypothetical protein
MILEIINPSDAVTIDTDDPIAACLIIAIIFNGQYSLSDEQGESVTPIFMFGGFEHWLKENGITDTNGYIKENAAKMADILDSALYGDAADRKIFESAISKMSKEDAGKFRAEWNANRRSSMNNISLTCQKNADKLRNLPDKPKGEK